MDKQIELDQADASQAPYNFVPLNAEVITVAEQDLPTRDRFHSNRHTGIIHCRLTTRSPLYIRGAEDGSFFTHGDPQQPALPGSSLRGMIRNIVEIITAAKMQPVPKNKLFFRQVFENDSRLHARYHSQLSNVEAGILHFANGDYTIQPCRWVKVPHKLLHDEGLTKAKLYYKKGRAAASREFPRWDDHKGPVQYRPVWVDVSTIDDNKATDILLTAPSDPSSSIQEGRLLITGHMNNKEHEYIFLFRPGVKTVTGNSILTAVEAVENDDQISEWQQNAYPVDQPQKNARRKPGALCDGDLIFYQTTSAGEVTSIGRTRYYRLPYSHTPYDLLPEAHRQAQTIDLAEAIFGFADKPIALNAAEKWTAAGRVYFSDGALTGAPPNIWLDPQSPMFKAKNLASPKPSAYRHYLVQTDTNSHKSYMDEATLRGFKRYWHRGRQNGNDPQLLHEKADFAHEDQVSETSQDVFIRPIRHGIQFQHKIHFENLSTAELGALVWAIQPPPPATAGYSYCHKLGMGKPLGMGSVQLEIQSIETIASGRYEQLFQDEGWHLAQSPQSAESLRRAFEQHMEEKLELADDEFGKQDRLMALLDLLRYPGVLADETDYVPLTDRDTWDNKLLPSPEEVYKTARLSLPSAAKEPRIIRKGQLIEAKVSEPDYGEEVYVTLTTTYDNLHQDNEHFEAWIEEEDRGGYGWQAKVGEKVTCIVLEVDPDGMYVQLRRKP